MEYLFSCITVRMGLFEVTEALCMCDGPHPPPPPPPKVPALPGKAPALPPPMPPPMAPPPLLPSTSPPPSEPPPSVAGPPPLDPKTLPPRCPARHATWTCCALQNILLPSASIACSPIQAGLLPTIFQNFRPLHVIPAAEGRCGTYMADVFLCWLHVQGTSTICCMH